MNLYVGNLLLNVGENDLRNAFEQFGQVTEVRMIMDKFSGQSKGFGFVEMPSKDEAEKAINEMNGKEFMGRVLNVNEAKPKTTHRGGGQGGGGGRGFGGQSRKGGKSSGGRHRY